MDSDDLNKELERRREAVRRGGGPKAVERQHAKGKRTAREFPLPASGGAKFLQEALPRRR